MNLLFLKKKKQKDFCILKVFWFFFSKKNIFFLSVVALSLFIADRLYPPDLSRAHREALLLRADDHSFLDARVSADGAWRLATTRADVDPAYIDLLLQTEDRRFAWHPGVDPLALVRAAGQLALRGHIVSGGSTLAMQTARLLTPHRHSWLGKLIDIARALQIEARYGRAGVLDLYLTLAPEGGNIEGIRAASLLWFGHEPNHLAPDEAAMLVALPRRPEALRPDRHPGRFAATRHPMPHAAPSLLAHAWAQRRTGVLSATLDAGLQRSALRVLSETPPPAAGGWASLIVRPDGRIAAWIGHAATSCPGCAADMVTAWRSPGSTLKPFIYALAFQDGLLNAGSALPDQPAGFDGYAPRDYDRMFHGATSVRVALQQSYNLPAVEALRAVGPTHFVAVLSASGVNLRLPGNEMGERAGLAIALGGVGIRMLDLARLYHALADGGVSAPLRWNDDRPALAEGSGQRLVDRPAAAAVLSILRGTPPPPGIAAWHDSLVAYKTGTSYGHRDAWAAAVAQGWTVIVWGGRPDGTPSPGISGRETAAPVMAALLDLLPLRRRLSDGADAAETSGALAGLRLDAPSGPQIISPANGATVESFAEDGTHPTPIGLEASGGTPPYRWMVDGRPLALGVGLTPAWTPVGPGFVHLAVIDAAGHAASTRFRVR